LRSRRHAASGSLEIGTPLQEKQPTKLGVAKTGIVVPAESRQHLSERAPEHRMARVNVCQMLILDGKDSERLVRDAREVLERIVSLQRMRTTASGNEITQRRIIDQSTPAKSGGIAKNMRACCAVIGHHDTDILRATSINRS